MNKPMLRRDAVSGEWVLVAPGRRSRPGEFTRKKEKPTPKSECPFEDPQKSGNTLLAWYDNKGLQPGTPHEDWTTQVIENKYPAVSKHVHTCPLPTQHELHCTMEGIGFHEVVVSRSHTKSLAEMKCVEVEMVLKAYQDRFRVHQAEECLKYILIFHNHGFAAGASLWHPHSQIIALPIVPPDVVRSLAGSKSNWDKHKKCVHCEYVGSERLRKERIIYENKAFTVLTPFASHTNFEIRVFPIVHAAHFYKMADDDMKLFADAVSSSLKRLSKVLDKPAYNFFIHTAPLGDGEYNYYHWHVEILPKTSHMAGVELGTGIEVITMPPEDAAKYLREVII